MLGEPEPALEYVTRAFQEMGENKETYYEWYKELNALDNICDLEIDVITDIISTDFDEIIPLSDGFIYFLNPLNIDEFELFDMYYTIIQSVQRDIPLIIVYYDSNGIIPIATNDLFENVWYNYPNLEVFINLPPIEFHQILECLCLAMIAGDTPLNIENAWMRFPIFIELANNFFIQQNYFYAAQSIKKAATISEIYNSNEFYIHCEQAAYLFSKENLYLEASKILEKVDRKKSKDFKKIYAEKMILEGNKQFNKKEYELAAIQYENAAQWTSIELDDKNLIQTSFKLGINSWISACKCEKAFKIFDRLPHKEGVEILVEITDKIINAANYLVSSGNLESAKDQLYYSIYIYQREGLFDELNKFTKKLVDVLIQILEHKIKKNELYSAKNAHDEIENLWEAYNLKKINLDKTLEKLIKLFIEELNFGMATILINKLNSLSLKQKLTELSSKTEEKKRTFKKQEIIENIQKGIDIVKKFIEMEIDIIAEMNTQKIEEANEYIKQKNYVNGAKIIKNQSIFLKNIGKEEIANQILTKSLDILIDAKLFDDFFNFYSDLSDGMKKKYLVRIFPVFIEKLKELKEEKNYEKKERIFEISNKKYRNEMLYDESKEISKLFIKVIKTEALRIVESEENISGINKATDLIKKVNSIVSSYLDQEKDKISFNKIYKKIAEIYISLEDLSSALTYSDKIDKKEYKTEVRKKLEKVESEIIKIKLKKVEESLKGEMLKERLSIIRKKGRDALHDRELELKQRKGLKRAYFKEALGFVKKQEFDNAIKSYRDSIIRLNRIKKYNLAGVSLAMAVFLLLKDEKLDDTIKILEEIKKKLSTSGKLFSEMFSFSLLEYIIDIKKLNDESKLKEALSYLENLPLFEEEIEILYDYLGKERKKEEKIEKKGIDIGEIAKLRSDVSKIIKNIKKEKKDIAKRKIMRRDYWNKALEGLTKNNLNDASLNYLNTVETLYNKKFTKYAAISLILGTLITIKDESVEIARKTFNKNLKKLWNIKIEKEALPEIQIMKYIFLAFENNIQEQIESILNHLAEKLILFEPEIEFLNTLSGEKKSEKKIEETLTRKKRGELSKLKVELDLTISNLQQKTGDIRSDSKDFFTKRKAMKRRYYDEILILLKNDSYREASKSYLDLSKNFIKRKDFKTGSLLILLSGLAGLKTEDSFIQVNIRINEFLGTLGLNKVLIEDTFYVKLFLFIIDIKMNNMNQYKTKIRSLLKILPIFEEEKELIEISI